MSPASRDFARIKQLEYGEERSMRGILVLSSVLALVTIIPLTEAPAHTSAGRGAVNGAIIGAAIGGRRGAAVGATAGAIAGSCHHHNRHWHSHYH
jgi:hypothetical protein